MLYEGSLVMSPNIAICCRGPCGFGDADEAGENSLSCPPVYSVDSNSFIQYRYHRTSAGQHVACILSRRKLCTPAHTHVTYMRLYT